MTMSSVQCATRPSDVVLPVLVQCRVHETMCAHSRTSTMGTSVYNSELTVATYRYNMCLECSQLHEVCCTSQSSSYMDFVMLYHRLYSMGQYYLNNSAVPLLERETTPSSARPAGINAVKPCLTGW